jgi:hypothetical protein
MCTWIGSDTTFFQSPLWTVVVDSFQEDIQHESPEGSQTSVEDDVEQNNLGCKKQEQK